VNAELPYEPLSFELDGISYVIRVPSPWRGFHIVLEVERAGTLCILRLSTDIAEVLAIHDALRRDLYNIREAVHAAFQVQNPLLPSGAPDAQVVLGLDRVSLRPYLKLLS
jgi:hypothetical protein